MKFGKELVSQMVPEWKEAYMDYNGLKTLIKEIHCFKQRNKAQANPRQLKRRLTLYRAFSGLTRRSNGQQSDVEAEVEVEVENQAILVGSVKQDGSSCSSYETMFLRTGDEGGEYELVYFKRLDYEFNKVVRFYRSKVEEVVEEADLLTKQMSTLIAFRIKVDKPHRWFNTSAADITRLASDVAASTAALSASTPRAAKAARRGGMDVIEEVGSSREGGSSEKSSPGNEKDVEEGKSCTINQNVEEKKTNSIGNTRPAPLEILNRVTMNNTLDTPLSTIKAFLSVSNNTDLSFNRENLRKIEEQLKLVFIVFYHKLRLLKSYSFLNLLAFSKIMKKYDKVTSREASKSYLQMVDNSYIGSSDEVTRLMERVETTFIKHFCNSNRRKGMRILRPKPKKERHGVTFSLGFFFGCSISLIVALVLIIRARNIVNHEGRDQYMENMFPLYSLFGFAIIHMLMYAANIYFWRRCRVNYSFIFGFKEGTELGYREVFLLSFGFAVLALASVLANLDMEMDPKTLDFKAITELIPLGLVLLVTGIMFCPFNIIYRSSRFFFLTCVFRCIFAPLYKVTLPDFFLADQLTSQVQAIRSLEFYVCYYGWGDYKLRENTCRTSDIYNTFYFIVAAIPYWSRLLQCLRRLCEERDSAQGLNALKYLSTIVAVSTRTAYTLDNGIGWRIIAWIASINSAIFSTYWDLVKDWGLLQWNSKNRFLRDKLLVPYQGVYFGAMALNVVLRFAWLQTVFNFQVPFLHRQALTTIVAILEIIRRGVWNFFRLENEHLNNVGKYRAFNSVPLPFNYDEEEDKDE